MLWVPSDCLPPTLKSHAKLGCDDKLISPALHGLPCRTERAEARCVSLQLLHDCRHTQAQVQLQSTQKGFVQMRPISVA